METILAVVGTVFSIVGIGVMVLQVRLAAIQKNLFILDRRYDFYDALVTFLSLAVETQTHVEIAYYLPYLSARRKAEFLFGEDVAKLIEEIDGNYGFFQMSLCENGPESETLRKQTLKALRKAYYEDLDIFQKYMKLPR